MNRRYRLERMEASLKYGLAANANESQQRHALNSIMTDAYFANEPVLEWLTEKLKGVSKSSPTLPEPSVVNELECPGCRKPFTSVASLNGHGPARCLDRKAREKGGSLS